MAGVLAISPPHEPIGEANGRRPTARASRLESRPGEPCHACGRHGVPLALVEAPRFFHGLCRAVLLTAGVQDLGELDEDVGSEVE
jgi:hypothetical protein